MSRPDLASAPSFFLYGEPPRDVSDRFIHLEALSDRSGPADWHIQAHAHANLGHLFRISRGEGIAATEAGVLVVTAPALLVVPARTIHAFQWAPDTVGQVLTVSRSYLEAMAFRDDSLPALLSKVRLLPLTESSPVAGDIERTFERLAVELSRHAPGQALAVESLVGCLLVDAARLDLANGGRGAGGARETLLARFRELVEAQHLTLRTTADYAGALGVSEARLQAACRACAQCAPLDVIQNRIVLEARRRLTYTTASVAEIGFHLGYDDPAYFSRLFRRRVGVSPQAYRGGRLTLVL